MIGEVGQLLIRSGYRVKVLNTINFSKSMKYNPFVVVFVLGRGKGLGGSAYPRLLHSLDL